MLPNNFLEPLLPCHENLNNSGSQILHLLNQLLVTITMLQHLCGYLVPSLNDYKGGELIGIFTTIMVLATLAVVARFVSRHIAAAKIGVDDYLILVALVRSLNILSNLVFFRFVFLSGIKQYRGHF